MMLPQRPLAGIFILFCAGIVMADHVVVPFWIVAGTAGLCLLASIVLFHKKTLSLLCLAATFMALGYVCFFVQRHLPRDHILYQGRPRFYRNVILEGVVASPIIKRDMFGTQRMSFTLEGRLLEISWIPRRIQGRVLVNIFRPRPFLQYGDYVRLWGKLHPPFNFNNKEGNSSYIDYLKRQGIFLVLDVKKTSAIMIKDHHQASWLIERSLRVRRRLAEVFDQYLSVSESGIMQAIILGERSRIPKTIKELFIRTGTAHVLAISGLHVGIVAAIIFVFCKLLSLPRQGQYLATIILLISYALVTGLRPSVVRATFMASIFLSSFMLERETDSINTLAAAGLVILLMRPGTLFDIGFQLSFASVYFIITLYPHLWALFSAKALAQNNKAAQYIFQSICVSCAAWLGVAGLIVYYFGFITPLSIVTNIVIIPFMTIVVVLGICLLITGVFLPFWAGIVASCLKITLNVMILVINLFAGVPFAYFSSKVMSWNMILIYYIFLVGFVAYLSYFERFRIKRAIR